MQLCLSLALFYHSVLLYHLFCSYVYIPLLTVILVSPDTSIAIAFGILSTVISVLGVWIGYLTLRAMAFETRTQFFFLQLLYRLFPSYHFDFVLVLYS